MAYIVVNNFDEEYQGEPFKSYVLQASSIKQLILQSKRFFIYYYVFENVFESQCSYFSEADKKTNMLLTLEKRATDHCIRWTKLTRSFK